MAGIMPRLDELQASCPRCRIATHQAGYRDAVEHEQHAFRKPETIAGLVLNFLGEKRGNL